MTITFVGLLREALSLSDYPLHSSDECGGDIRGLVTAFDAVDAAEMRAQTDWLERILGVSEKN